jgi:hypothetical protein
VRRCIKTTNKPLIGDEYVPEIEDFHGLKLLVVYPTKKYFSQLELYGGNYLIDIDDVTYDYYQHKYELRGYAEYDVKLFFNHKGEVVYL